MTLAKAIVIENKATIRILPLAHRILIVVTTHTSPAAMRSPFFPTLFTNTPVIKNGTRLTHPTIILFIYVSSPLFVCEKVIKLKFTLLGYENK